MSRGKQDKKNNMGTFVWGTILGAIGGAIAAFWYAPQSGKETRHDIHEKVEDVVEDIEATAKDVRQRIEGESIEDTLEAAKAEARRYQEAAKR